MSCYFCNFYRTLLFFFFNDTATTEIYTLSLHDALPICRGRDRRCPPTPPPMHSGWRRIAPRDRKSTRLNSSHGYISYAVFCLKKKKKQKPHIFYIANTQSLRVPFASTRA